MSVRIDDRELNRLLTDWLDEGPKTAADFVVERALERVPTVRRRGASWLARLPHLLRAQAPLVASLIVLLVLGTALVVALGFINGPVVPAPSEPPIASSLPTGTVVPSASASEEAAFDYGATGEIDAPGHRIPAGSSWGTRAPDDTGSDVSGFQFGHGCCSAETAFLIFIDPDDRDWVGTWSTDGSGLRVLIRWTLAAAGNANLVRTGTFWSDAGECQVTFETFHEDLAAGSMHCESVPGQYSDGRGNTLEGVVSLLDGPSFGFDPTPYIPPIPGQSPRSDRGDG